MAYQGDMYAGYDPDQALHDNEMLDHGNDDFGDDNDGWGVDSDLYTTTLNTQKLTKAQIDEAIRLEQEILSEGAGNQGGGGGYDRYEYTEEEGGYDTGAGAAPGGYSAQGALVDSPEEAMRMLAQRKRGQAAPQAARGRPAPAHGHAQRRPARPAAVSQQRQVVYGTAQDEIRAYHELCRQYQSVQAKLAVVGEPTPSQKKKFLQNLTRGLIACLRYPVPEVRSAISNMFLKIGWDVRRNRSPPSVKKPPSGGMLKELLAKTVDFFGARHNLPKRSKYTLPPRRNVARPSQPQQRRGQHPQRGGRGGGSTGRGRGRQQNYNNYNQRGGGRGRGRGGYDNRGGGGGRGGYRGQGGQRQQYSGGARSAAGGGGGGGGARRGYSNRSNTNNQNQNQNRNRQNNNQRRDRNGPH